MERNNTIDIARGIGMLGIVMLHMQLVITYPFGASAVSLFFLISGYLMKPIANKIDYIKNRLKRLLVPYGFTALMMLLCGVLANTIFPTGKSNGQVALEWIYAAFYGAGDPYTEPFYIKSIGGIWFFVGNSVGRYFYAMDYRKKQGLADYLCHSVVCSRGCNGQIIMAAFLVYSLVCVLQLICMLAIWPGRDSHG